MTARRLLSRLAIPALLSLAALALLGDSSQPDSAQALAGGGQISFARRVLDQPVNSPASLAFGPDGRLYVSSLDAIQALTLDPVTKDVTAVEPIATNLDEVTGLAFDPTAPPSPVVLYATRRNAAATDGYEGVVSRFTAPSWTRQDVITGLPNSTPHTNHYTNGIAFDNLGRLYMAQGSNTDSGLADPFYPETPLSAAILRADIHAPGFNGAITYSPAGTPTDDNVDQVGGNVSVFASGTRNPYDLVLHSNGLIYATDNGPNGPATSLSCTTEGGAVVANDELNLIESGNYYGFPNRNRGRSDSRQCVYRSPLDGDGNGATGPIHTFQEHCSCNGLAEYSGGAFGGAMTGDLLVAQFIFGSLARVELAPDGRSVTSVTTLASGLSLPLDVTVGADGTVYIGEFSANRITFLAPDSDRDGCADVRETGLNQTAGGRRDPKNFWDFFDTPGSGNVRDAVVSVLDITRLVARFGASGSATTINDALAPPPPAPAYHAGFDRTNTPGGDLWDTNAANGSITVQDISMSVYSFGHSCI